MLHKFGIHFEYSTRTDIVNGAGESIKGYSKDRISVYEPLLPYNQGDLPASSGQTTRQVVSDLGVIETSDHVWYSLLDVPIGSRVYHNGNQYEVMAKDDYTDYSDVCIYYLKGQTDL